MHRQWSVDVPKAITIPLSVQTADPAWMSVEEQCPGYLWYSYHAHLALQFHISALCGCCAVGLLWYGVSGMCCHQLYLSIHNIHGQMHVDYQNGLTTIRNWVAMPFAFSVLLYVAVPLQFYCHTQTYSTFLSVILISNGSMTIALIATCTIYICESQVACICYSFTYRNFLSLVSFASDFYTAGHFS